MRVELKGTTFSLHGDRNPVAQAAIAELAANGGADVGDNLPDLQVISLPLLPDANADFREALRTAGKIGDAMFARGSGRILFLCSAAAGMPMRRHPEFSVAMAGVLATVRTLAMRLGPKVLVNALGVGAVGEPLLAGDAAMLGHASVKRPGTVVEVTDTLLFFADPLNSYTTGQLLSVDGGWSAGYGRSF